MAGIEGEPAVDVDLKERAMDEAPVGITISDPDCEDNPLIYVNEAFEHLTGYPREEVLGRNCRFLQGEGTDPDTVAEIAAAIDAAEPVSVELLNYRASGEPFWNEVTIAPIRDADGQVTNFVGFQDDVTARKRAQLEVERRRAELDHLVRRINALLGDVTAALMHSTSRDEDERAATEHIAAADPFVFAWFGEPDLATETIVPTTWAGDGGPLDGVDIDVDTDDPTARAYATRSMQTDRVEDTACEDHVVGAQSMAAVPVGYQETVYGVLTVYAADPDAFDERETVVIQALARTIGTAINARQSQRILTAHNVVELEFVVRDRGLFVADISARCACRLEFEGAVNRDDGSLSLFFSTDGTPSEIVEAASACPGVEATVLGERETPSGIVECHVSTSTIVAELAERSVKTRDISADDGVARLTLELPPTLDSRAIVELVRERYPESDLVARREHERPPTTKAEFIAGLEGRLTDRQLAVLQTAYLGGYYDRTRGITGEELAASMDISRSTFHQHLRTAERKLIEEFFEDT